MVVVFGSINLDLVAKVARMPGPGETLSGSAFSSMPGGKGANQALAAARAGAPVRMFGAVGRDAFAASALANLEASGIDLSGVVAVDASTGVALIHVDVRGENAITVVAGANANARAAQVPDGILAPGTTLVMQLEVPLAQVAQLAARANGAHVILNAAPAVKLDDGLLRNVGTLIVNESEAAAVAADLGLPATPDGFADAASARYRFTAIVTLGSRGAIAVRGSEKMSVAAPGIEVVDTTGAGDAMVGTYAAAIDRGEPLRRALAEGVAAGSLACTGRGAQGALPLRSAIATLAATL